MHYNLTTKPEVSVALFVRELLRRLQTDLHQTWQGGQGQAWKTPHRTCFHGNHHVVMATKKTVFLMARSALWWDIRLPVIIHEVTSPMTSCDVTLAVTSWKPSTVVSRHFCSNALFWAT